MAVFMFWNVGECDAADSIAALCSHHGVDVIVLAESPADISGLMQVLGNGEHPYREVLPGLSKRLRMFSRYPDRALRPVFDDGHVSIRNLTPPVGAQVLVVAVHLPSKLRLDDRDQYYRVRQLRVRITNAEAEVGHQNTLVIGDLNANPFEEAIAAADGLHGVMDKRVAGRPARVKQGTRWDYFYNPMWSRLGDESPGPPGTYFRAADGILTYFWHCLDQALLRPSLLPYYDVSSLSVISEVDNVALISKDGSRRSGVPDHLPLVIRLAIEKERSSG